MRDAQSHFGALVSNLINKVALHVVISGLFWWAYINYSGGLTVIFKALLVGLSFLSLIGIKG
jgi:hypothetical protein